jgi:SAM-dependent methyltransferase
MINLKCKGCQSNELSNIVDFGYIPLAGDFIAGANAKRYPLMVDCCSCCGLLQVRENVPLEILFNDKYCYSSSTVPSLVAHFGELAATIRELGVQNVFEIGANDGILLKALLNKGIKAEGVDASENMVNEARLKGANCDSGFFGQIYAREKMEKRNNRKYDLITCSNVFAHNPNLQDFLLGVDLMLSKDGMFLIEVHDSDLLFSTNQWDFIYHEHCFYWTIESLRNVLSRFGFRLVKSELTPMHGGSLRCFFGRAGIIQDLRAVETRKWEHFAENIQRTRNTIYETIEAISPKGISLYGAAGRATTMVNVSKIGELIADAYDGSPYRIGRQIPGTNIEIRGERYINEMKQFVLLGAWHLKDSLIKKAGKNHIYIIPLPSVTIL